MSVTRITSIHCDGCGDWDYGDAVSVEGKAAYIRRYLKAFGWTTAPGGRDFCKACSERADASSSAS